MPSRAFSRSARLATSPWISSASRESQGGTPRGWTRGWRLSSTRTWCPCSKSRSTVCEPMKPAPPVTSIFMGKSVAGAADHGHGRPGQDLDLQPERPAVDVLQVQPRPLREVSDRVAAARLPDAGDAGHDAELAHLP